MTRFQKLLIVITLMVLVIFIIAKHILVTTPIVPEHYDTNEFSGKSEVTDANDKV